MKPTVHDGTTTPQPPRHTTTEKYDDTGKGCIISISHAVEMLQSYTVNHSLVLLTQ